MFLVHCKISILIHFRIFPAMKIVLYLLPNTHSCLLFKSCQIKYNNCVSLCHSCLLHSHHWTWSRTKSLSKIKNMIYSVMAIPENQLAQEESALVHSLFSKCSECCFILKEKKPTYQATYCYIIRKELHFPLTLNKGSKLWEQFIVFKCFLV